MLVPLELDILAKQRGYLSSELALGWRIGIYISDFFSNLEDVRIAARADGDAAMGISMLCRKNSFPFPVTISQGHRPWDFLTYHYPTGTVLKFIAASEQLDLPNKIQRLECRFDDENRTIADNAVRLYRLALDEQIVRILYNPVESYCRIVESQVRFLDLSDKQSQDKLRCRKCGHFHSRVELLDLDGVICCVSCAELETAWFQWA